MLQKLSFTPKCVIPELSAWSRKHSEPQPMAALSPDVFSHEGEQPPRLARLHLSLRTPYG